MVQIRTDEKLQSLPGTLHGENNTTPQENQLHSQYLFHTRNVPGQGPEEIVNLKCVYDSIATSQHFNHLTQYFTSNDQKYYHSMLVHY